MRAARASIGALSFSVSRAAKLERGTPIGVVRSIGALSSTLFPPLLFYTGREVEREGEGGEEEKSRLTDDSDSEP